MEAIFFIYEVNDLKVLCIFLTVDCHFLDIKIGINGNRGVTRNFYGGGSDFFHKFLIFGRSLNFYLQKISLSRRRGQDLAFELPLDTPLNGDVFKGS